VIEPLDDLLERARAGTAALVVVEGETRNDDPKVYGRWFGHLARDLSFVHQDGHRQVKKAVAYLREHAPGRPVFGLIDRDFTSRDETDVTDALEHGLFRTGWYTLENYFFADATAWMQIVEVLNDDPPDGWRTIAEIEARITDAYRRALPLAAWNRIVCNECRRSPGPGKSPEYRDNPKAISEEALVKLTKLGQERGAPRPLGEEFAALLLALEALPPETWPEHVTGKAVLSIFAQEFPALHSTRDKPGVLRRLYMDKHPAPPPDLAAIVDTMLRETEHMRRRHHPVR
jgi:hypothetical protein